MGRLVGVAGAAGSRFFAARGTQHAAGIAYRVLFSLAPLAIVLVSVFGLVLQDDDVREEIVDAIVDVLPIDASGQADVEQAIEDIATPASAAGLVSLLVFFWAASGMMAAIRRGLEAVAGVEGRAVVPSKLVDLALVGGAALLVLVSVAVGLVAELVNELVREVAALVGVSGSTVESTISVGLPFFLWIATVLLLYRFVPAARLNARDSLAGAIVTAVLMLAISLASAVLYRKTTEWSLIYGSLTTVLVFLYSVYLYAVALLFGVAVATEWSRPHEPSAEPLRVRIRHGARGLFVRRPR